MERRKNYGRRKHEMRKLYAMRTVVGALVVGLYSLFSLFFKAVANTGFHSMLFITVSMVSASLVLLIVILKFISSDVKRPEELLKYADKQMYDLKKDSER